MFDVDLNPEIKRTNVAQNFCRVQPFSDWDAETKVQFPIGISKMSQLEKIVKTLDFGAFMHVNTNRWFNESWLSVLFLFLGI